MGLTFWDALAFVLFLTAVIVISLLYVWTLYNIPIVVAGIRNLRSGKRKRKSSGGSQESLPTISIIVPVYNGAETIKIINFDFAINVLVSTLLVITSTFVLDLKKSK